MNIKLYQGLAKIESEFARASNQQGPFSPISIINLNPKHRGIFHVTTKEEIIACDVSRLIANYSSNTDISRLKQVQSRISYTISGYDEDTEELFEIPEVRRFYAKAHGVCPSWLFTADPSTCCLFSVVLSILANFTVVKVAGDELMEVWLPDQAVEDFFIGSLDASIALFKRSHVRREKSELHLRSLARYLGVWEL
ncbi:hypothetical protein BH09VER1_BH09VER1_17820 [soil metagenome]